MTLYALIPIRYAYLPIEKIPALLVPALPLTLDFFILWIAVKMQIAECAHQISSLNQVLFCF